MTLTPRLALAAQLCAGGRALIDVGCDHAYLSLHLVARGGFDRALACDLRPGPLQSAQHNIAAQGLGGRIETRLCDGLTGLTAADGDTVAICGMGGELIAAILAAAPWTARGEHRLVLQPQSRSERLRAFLAQRGYTVEREALAAEGDRLYCVLQARGGGPPMGQAQGFLFTPHMVDDRLFGRYLDALEGHYRKVLAGQRLGGQDTRETEDILALLGRYQNEYKQQ